MRIQQAATLLLALEVLALSSCKTTDAPTKTISNETTTLESTGEGRSDHSLSLGPKMGPRTQGVPHSANIDMVRLSSDGTMALSRDSLGGLRLWPSLDGASEPVLVPVRGALDFSLASAATSIVISAVDSIGALHILRAGADGSVEELYMSSPHAPMVQAIVLEGGEQLVVLSKDYKLSLLSVDGEVQSVIEQRRFRPTAMRIAESKQQVLAIESNLSRAGSDVVLKTVDYDPAKKTLSLRSDEREIAGVLNVAHRRFALSPDAIHVAYLGFETESEKSAGESKPPVSGPRPAAASLEPRLKIANLATGATQAIDLPIPSHEIMSAHLAFAGDRQVVVSSRPSGGSWSVAIEEASGENASGEKASPTPIPSAVTNDHQRHAADVAGGTRLQADGNWLFVQDLAGKSHHYLGYGPFDPQSASISPNGERVAWSTGAMVFVESIRDTGKSVRIVAAPTEAYFRAGFVDDAHIAAIDYSGGLHIIDWEKGTQVATLDTGGAVRDFEIDPTRGLLRGIRQNSGSWLVEFGNGTLQGPHLIQDGGYRSGFLEGEDGIWSMDGSNKLRTFRLDEIRAGLSTRDLKRDPIDISKDLPVAIDRRGTHYVLRSDNNGAKLTIGVPGGDSRELRLRTTPAQIVPSPDGKKLALQFSGSATVEVVSAEDARSLWSRSFLQGIRHISWSSNSESLAVAAQVGAIVQDAQSGAPLRLGCAPWFEKRDTPPATTVTFLQVQNLCERNTAP